MMKKIMILFVVLIFVGLGTAGYQMVQIWNQTEPVYQQAKAVLETELPDVTIVHQDIYNGEEQWVWFEVQDSNGEGFHVLIPSEKKDKQFACMIRKTLGGISKEEAKVLVTQSEHPKKMDRVVLGVEEGRIVWEITYRDDSNRWNYYYLDFTTGEFVKSFTL